MSNNQTKLLWKYFLKSNDPNIVELREQALVTTKMIHGDEVAKEIRIMDKKQKDIDNLVNQISKQSEGDDILILLKTLTKNILFWYNKLKTYWY